jgi:hypothetical protein
VGDSTAKPKIFVFCNQKGCRGQGQWHNMLALAEDGTGLAAHACSSHAWAFHDMGIHPDGWKRDLYAKHYPDGFDVVWVDDPDTHEGFKAACAAAAAKAQGANNG